MESGGILTETQLREEETNQILSNSTEQLSGSRQEYLNAMVNSGTSIYTLTIHYIDSKGNRLTDDYVGQYIEGESFEIRSPNIDGYIPDYQTVSSSDTRVTDGNGMPARNVEVNITYRKNSIPKGEKEEKRMKNVKTIVAVERERERKSYNLDKRKNIKEHKKQDKAYLFFTKWIKVICLVFCALKSTKEK